MTASLVRAFLDSRHPPRLPVEWRICERRSYWDEYQPATGHVETLVSSAVFLPIRVCCSTASQSRPCIERTTYSAIHALCTGRADPDIHSQATAKLGCQAECLSRFASQNL